MNVRQFGLDLIKRSSALLRLPLRKFELDVMSEEWDTLIILDACRYDLYRDVIDSEATYKISNGTASGQFMRNSFGGGQYHDTVYVTANPWALTEIDDDTFFEVRHVWNTHWDDDRGTVMPEDVVAEAEDAFAAHPNKRYIVHFMQPHHPFLGPKGRELGDFGGFRKARDRAVKGTPSDTRHVWNLLDDGQLSRDDVWEAYRENLEFVFPYAEEVAELLGGRTVVTSDHGNLFDEFAWPYPFRFSAHPEGVWTPKLVMVPWHVLREGDRRVEADDPGSTAEISADVREKLERLGYAE